MNKRFSIILATDEKNWIGKKWNLAWNLSSDLKYFKKITTQITDKNKKNAVIMWRKTWESIPKRFRPLPWRTNCVLSRTTSENLEKNILWFTSLKNCLEELKNNKNIENIFIIWWAKLYNDSLINSNLEKIFITKVSWSFDCDVFFDWVPEVFKLESKSETQEEKDIKFSFEIWKRK